MPTRTSTTSCSARSSRPSPASPTPRRCRTLVFEPLAMHHTTADLERARALGLGDAHRMWFGLALARTAAVPRRPRAGRLHRLDRRGHGPTDRDAPGRRRRRWAAVPQRRERRRADDRAGTSADRLGSLRDGLGGRHARRAADRSATTAARPTWPPSRRSRRRPGPASWSSPTPRGSRTRRSARSTRSGSGRSTRCSAASRTARSSIFYPVLDVALLVLLAFWLRGLVRLARRPGVASP